MALKKYRWVENGYETELLLNDEDARRLGLLAPAKTTKADQVPQEKAAPDPKDKAAPDPANKGRSRFRGGKAK